MELYEKDGTVLPKNRIRLRAAGGGTVFNPTDSRLRAAGWLPYTPPAPEPYTPSYAGRVEELVRERYSVSDELAILRQRDVKTDDFAAYYEYCEACKRRAKEEGD